MSEVQKNRKVTEQTAKESQTNEMVQNAEGKAKAAGKTTAKSLSQLLQGKPVKALGEVAKGIGKEALKDAKQTTEKIGSEVANAAKPKTPDYGDLGLG